MTSPWPWPIALACATTVGLVCGLVFDGLGDVVAWCGLALPVAVVAWHGRRAFGARARLPAAMPLGAGDSSITRPTS